MKKRNQLSMRIPSSLSAIFLAGFLSFPATASSLLTVDTLLAQQDYRAATTLLSRHLDSFPNDNNALYMLVAVEQTRILDYESYTIESGLLFKKADSVNKILNARLPQLSGRDSIRCLFYIATINGCISVLQAKTGDLFPALKNAIESITVLNEVVGLDSGYCEAYMGIGLFQYYLNKSFTWLPFIDAKSEMEGMRKIEIAVHAPFPYDLAAKNSLCWVLIERTKFKKVDSLAGGVLSMFPDNTIFLRIRCLNALWGGKYDEAVVLGERLSQITLKRTPENWSDLVLAYYAISSGNSGLGRKKEACAAADFILGAGIPQVYRDMPHIKKNLRRIRSIRKK